MCCGQKFDALPRDRRMRINGRLFPPLVTWVLLTAQSPTTSLHFHNQSLYIYIYIVYLSPWITQYIHTFSSPCMKYSFSFIRLHTAKCHLCSFLCIQFYVILLIVLFCLCNIAARSDICNQSERGMLQIATDIFPFH